MVLSLKKFMSNIIFPEHPNQKGIFLKRIGSLLEEGYSLKDALSFLEKIEKGHSNRWIQEIQKGMLLGHSFHEEIEKLNFPTKTSAQIYFASQYGDYGQTITNCGNQLLKELEKKNKLRSLMTYPVLLMLFLFGMLMMMRFVILPHMEFLFMSFDSSSGIYANTIVRLIHYSPQIIAGVFIVSSIGFLFVRKKLRKGTMIEGVTFLIKQPFLKTYLKDYWTAFFFHEWGGLLKNGCSFQEVISIMQAESASKLLQETGGILKREMEAGRDLHESLKVLPFFHEEGLMVVQHGENLGKISTEMMLYASYCENELSQRIERLMDKLQPIIFVFIASMIVAIYASLMLPIFTLIGGI